MLVRDVWRTSFRFPSLGTNSEATNYILFWILPVNARCPSALEHVFQTNLVDSHDVRYYSYAGTIPPQNRNPYLLDPVRYICGTILCQLWCSRCLGELWSYSKLSIWIILSIFLLCSVLLKDCSRIHLTNNVVRGQRFLTIQPALSRRWTFVFSRIYIQSWECICTLACQSLHRRATFQHLGCTKAAASHANLSGSLDVKYTALSHWL